MENIIYNIYMEDFTDNKDVIRAHNFFENKLSPEEKELLVQYKGEIDEDDWRRFSDDDRFTEKGPLNYIAINFLLKTDLHIPLSRDPPDLIQRLTPRDWDKQILSCIDLIFLLKKFPKTKKDLFVYRGQPQYDFYETLREGQHFDIKPFFSTTLNIEVAKSFGGRSPHHLIKILIPAGNRLPFISKALTLLPNFIRGGSEAEVLLPPGCNFIYNGKTSENGIEIYNIELIGVPNPLARGSFTEMFKTTYEPKAGEIVSRYYKEEEESEESEGAKEKEEGSGRKKKTKKKRKNKNTRKYKKKLIYKKYKQSSIYQRWI